MKSSSNSPVMEKIKPTLSRAGHRAGRISNSIHFDLNPTRTKNMNMLKGAIIGLIVGSIGIMLGRKNKH